MLTTANRSSKIDNVVTRPESLTLLSSMIRQIKIIIKKEMKKRIKHDENSGKINHKIYELNQNRPKYYETDEN